MGAAGASANYLNAAGAVSIAEALRVNTALTSVDLRGERVARRGQAAAHFLV
jgi:hypothetical protein